MARFAASDALPADYGSRLDERVVEYPWVLSRLQSSRGRILDAGSTFSTDLVLDLPWIAGAGSGDLHPRDRRRRAAARVHFVYGDLRSLAFRGRRAVTCISTIEHVGMAQSFAYSAARPYPDARPDDGLLAWRSFGGSCSLGAACC